MKPPCFDFVWSGNESARITRIVHQIIANNPGRPIPSNKVQSFRSPNEVDKWFFSNPMQSPGALHFWERSSTEISYGIQTNSTSFPKRGIQEDTTFKFQIPLQLAAEREIGRSLIGDPKFSWDVSLMGFPHPSRGVLSTFGTVGPTFFLAIAMFGFVFQISALTAEKELKLRQAMNMMGLYDAAYWLSWFTWEGIIALLSSLFTVLFGMIFQFDFFLHNSFAVVFLLFFLFQLNMVGFAFMLSAFISKSASSTTVGFSVFIVGFVTQLVTVFGFPFSHSFSNIYRVIWLIFPPNILAEGLQLLSLATRTPGDPGVRWNTRMKCSPNAECLITINDLYLWLVSTFFVWSILSIYFDNIIPNASGLRKSVFYFLKPVYWLGKGGNQDEEGGVCSCISSIPPLESITPDDGDVLEEENIVKQKMEESTVDASVAVQIRGLVKIYPGRTKISCCKCKHASPYHALKGLWVNIAKDQLFCLLGPNGAGKTTAINCLTGITPVTGGDALVYGHSIRSSTGMSNIQKIIGVCPQFDILWDALSGEEHLRLFSTIKGLPPASIKLTTGMDPISRRHVWDIIETAKIGRTVVLTTHSMEEADILSDRIGIMAKGRLRCIGTSVRLKSRFGAGFIATISFLGHTDGTSHSGDNFTEDHHEVVKQFVQHRLDVLPKEENKSYLTFVIPCDKERLLTNFFTELEYREREFRIADIQIGLTTLEEVFLNIAKKAELESASIDGSFASLTLNSGVSVQVPIGARFIGIPGTESTENPNGIMVEVFWEQDDSGALCISNHSPEMPIPSYIQLQASSRIAAPPRNVSSGLNNLYGVVIYPNQISNTST